MLEPPCLHRVADVCVGVPPAPVCRDTYCTADAPCSQILEVASGSALRGALTAAEPGSCIALAPGQYGDVEIPRGVSLLGRGADHVQTGRLSMAEEAFEGALMLRGITTSGVTIHGSATIVGVRVQGSSGDGFHVTSGAVADILLSEVLDPPGVGINARDAAGLRVRRSYVRGSNGAALWAQCGTGCDCLVPTTVVANYLLAEDSRQYGVVLLGVDASGSYWDVLRTRVGEDFQSGGGISASQCARIAADGLRIETSAFFGIMVDDATGVLGGPIGVEVSGATLGVVFARIGLVSDGSVELVGADVHDNAGVGVCMGASSGEVVLKDSRVSRTASASFPSPSGGVLTAGEGIQWTPLTTGRLEGLSLSDNERQSILIDGPVGKGSAMERITLQGADAASGVLQQNVSDSGTSPTQGPGAPAIQREHGQIYDVVCP